MRAIIVSDKVVGYGEGSGPRWIWCGCWACVPEGVGGNAEVAGMFVVPFVELDFKLGWIAGLEILMAVDMVSA